MLYDNFPNPFNPSTKVRFDISASSNVKLAIYDAGGKEISVPVNSFLNAGKYEAAFDASGLASGTYFYRLDAGEFSQTKKMVLLK